MPPKTKVRKNWTLPLNQTLRGHDAYYGIAGNLRSLRKVHRAVERYRRKILSSRGAGTARSLGSNSNGSSRSSRCLNRSSTSLTRSYRPSPNCESTSDEPSAGNPHAGFCGSRRRVTASGHSVAGPQGSSLVRTMDTARRRADCVFTSSSHAHADRLHITYLSSSNQHLQI